ncbi:TBC1 domain family member 2B isoform X3 [Penaeus vannamei]|uniref:TBC1 domain family member 2B isoform X3 n=1 Tax=Penaeus vannamei TaxID=6689 RepID=UPI00387F9ADE
MFYQDLEPEERDHALGEEIRPEARARAYSSGPSRSKGSAAVESKRPKSWSRGSDSLTDIEEKDESKEKNPRKGYNLSGYLYKHPSSSKRHVPGLRGLTGSSIKKRWFVYSDRVCKLYYYKQKNDSEPIGTIDIALATFFFDPESKNEGLFTIRCANDEWILEASSAQGRMYWIQQLQAARREFSQRRTATATCRSPNASQPEMGLLHDNQLKSPDPTPDPHSDLMKPVSKPSDTEKGNLPPKHPSALLDARLALSNFLPNTQKKIFRTNSESPKSPTSPLAVRHSPVSSPSEDLSFGNLGKRLRSSIKARRSTSFEGKDGNDIANLHNARVVCRKCEELQGKLNSAKEDLVATQDEYQASREVIDLLQKELDAIQQEKATLITLDRSDLTDTHVLEILRGKDHHIVNLEHENQKLTNDIAKLKEQLSDAQSHNEHLSEKLSMLYCLIEAKDKAIVNLTHQVDENTSNVRPVSLPPSLTFTNHDTTTRGTQTSSQQEDALKDALEAYRCQNTFLNKEILELNLLRKHCSEREQKLITESSEWEAKFYQIQSKYLLLLNELHSPQTSQHDPSIVSQLLQDVVEAHGSPDLRVIHNKGREYDEYGFCITAPGEGSLQSRANYLQKQSQALANQVQQNGSSWEERWESFLAGTSAKELPSCTDLKFLIRGGIPYQYKGKVWRLLIDCHVSRLKAAVPSNYYQDLLARRTVTATLDPAAKQIELDLLRTLPNNRHYETYHSDGIARLRRVLLAFSRHNPQVGYCQGLNRLAAIALLFLNEEDAFWCLIYIVDFLMPPDYYNRNLLGSLVDQRVLKDLVAEKLPRLNAHMEQHGLDISLFTFNWFLCVYIDTIPPITYLTIWDSFLYEGSKVLFRYALAIFKLCEDGVMERCDYMEIFSYLRSVPEPITDIPRLQEAAFHWVNPLSMRYLRNRRAHHINIVKAELEEVEVVRRSYHNAKAKNNRKAQVLEAPCSPTSPSPVSSEDEQSGEDNAEEPKAKQGEGASQTEEKPDDGLDTSIAEDKGVSEAAEQVEKLELEEGEPESVTERL